MFNKFVEAITPFGLTLIVFAGAAQAGWVAFTNNVIVGIATVVVGVLLIVNHIVLKVTSKEDK